MDAVGYNDVNFNLTGPLWTKYKGTDSADARIGFFLARRIILRTQDGSPSSIGYWKLKDNVLANLVENPLIKSSVSNAFLPAANALTADSLQHINSKLNSANNTFTGAGKLDFKITDNIDVVVGGNANYGKGHDYVLTCLFFNERSK